LTAYDLKMIKSFGKANNSCLWISTDGERLYGGGYALDIKNGQLL